MNLTYNTFSFTKILGWSSSRYEIFDKCKRQYFYNYYSNFVPGIPSYKIKILKSMTSVALEVGNVVHDVLEAFLRRLQKSDRNIDENRFFQFARQKADDYFSHKTLIEIYYGKTDFIEKESIYKKIDDCLKNFINSPIYSWIFMKAITNRNNWMIEPEGYGETRLNGIKAYCKMDFLFPVDGYIYILDWKTGKKSEFKQKNQLIGYASAASNNFNIPWNIIFPKIIYLYPEFDEFEIDLKEDDFENFFKKVVTQTEEMHSYCSDIENNIPLHIDKFPKTPTEQICNYCNFQELCFPEIKEQNNNEEF
jgi:CRISPR/Cas system-associated exonuclease Cas4 (RecB family)